MEEYKTFRVQWTTPDPGRKGNVRIVEAKVDAINKDHAVSKLLSDVGYQMSLLIAFGEEIESGIFNHQFLMWLPDK